MLGFRLCRNTGTEAGATNFSPAQMPPDRSDHTNAWPWNAVRISSTA